MSLCTDHLSCSGSTSPPASPSSSLFQRHLVLPSSSSSSSSRTTPAQDSAGVLAGLHDTFSQHQACADNRSSRCACISIHFISGPNGLFLPRLTSNVVILYWWLCMRADTASIDDSDDFTHDNFQGITLKAFGMNILNSLTLRFPDSSFQRSWSRFIISNAQRQINTIVTLAPTAIGSACLHWLSHFHQYK